MSEEKDKKCGDNMSAYQVHQKDVPGSA